MKCFRLREDCVVRAQGVMIITIVSVEKESEVAKDKKIQRWVVGVSYGEGQNAYSETFPDQKSAQAYMNRLLAGEFTFELTT